MKTMKIKTPNKTVRCVTATAFLAATNASIASTILLGSLTPFTGGDAGEGLDLTGNIVHAYNLGGTAQTVQGVTFAAAPVGGAPAGITPSGALEFNYSVANPGGANGANYGATVDDNALETLTSTGWYNSDWTLDLAVVAGNQYKLQLIFQESFWDFQGGLVAGAPAERNFNVLVETGSPATLSVGLANFVPGVETNGANTARQPGADFGVVYTYNFTAPDTSFRIRLQDNPGGDDNAVLNALTLTQIPEPSAALLGGLGFLALLRRRR
ncbi:MAG: PEP-CTERM sorting domain-containing protein [Akkermansiaceae bacterium]|jgi:hypothetical protein